MDVLDSNFELSTFNIFNSFPNTHSPDKLCARVLSVREQNASTIQRRHLTTSKINAYSQGITSVTIFEVGLKQVHLLGELSGSRILRFNVVPETFRNN